jgi:pimeloyl-ACP methyl ester carboxylesterase
VELNGLRSIFPGAEELWADISGARIRYLAAGSGSPVVLVHGVAASSFSWRLNFAELARKFRVYAPDLANLGYSVRVPKLDASLPATAERLLGFMDATSLNSADIVGSSYGGSVVMQMAASAPHRFRRMVLISPANPFAGQYEPVLRFYLSFLGGVFMRSVPFLPGRAWEYGIGRMYADPHRMATGTGIGYARPLRQRGTTRFILAILKTLAYDIEALREKLPAMASVPALLIWGDCDRVVELASGLKLKQALGAEMAVMKGVGHLPYEETPEEFNTLLLGYLRGGRIS